MITSEAEGRRWSDLPDLFLNLVARRLSLVDHMQFGLVCKSWRSVAIGAPHCRQPPYLLARSRRELLCYSFWEYRTIRFPVPSWLTGFEWEWDCCAASHGWLFMADQVNQEFCLLNPVTRAQINLPPLLSWQWYDFRDCRTALSSDPVTAAARGDRALVVVEDVFRTYICRLGDKHWTILRDSDDTPIRSVAVVFHKGLPHMMEDHRTLVTYDLDYNKSRTVPRCFDDKWKEWTCYLVEDDRQGADLLQVLVGSGRCVVLNLVDVKDSSSQQWVRMSNLGGGALFVSKKHSESVSADVCVAAGITGDCVYELNQSFLLLEMSIKDGSEPAAIRCHLSAEKFDIAWFNPRISSP